MTKTSTKYSEDLMLVTLALSGNQKAFARIVNQYEPSIAKTTMGMLGNQDEAEDVGQETFIRFYNAMKQYKGDAALGTYLTRIAINLSLNAIKKRKRRRWIPLDKKSETQYHVVDFAKARDDKEQIDLALSQLNPEFRSVVVVRLLQGYSTKETSEILNIPQGTVLSRLSRAQLKLKEMFNSTDKNHGKH